MARSTSVLQTRFFYVATVFGVSFGVVSLMWHLKGTNWTLGVFSFGWVLLLSAFAYEIVTRAERLDRIVHARTDALEETNRNLSRLLDQLSAFLQISYVVNQKLEIRETTLAFVSQLHKSLPEVDAAWLWLDRAVLRSEGAKSATRYQTVGPLVLSGQAGHSFGMPAALKVLRRTNPLISPCFEAKRAAIHHELRTKGLSWGWKWLAASGMESFAGFPLRLGRNMLGVLGVFSREPLSAEFVSQMYVSVNQVTVALEKARLLREMRKRAEELTAANRELRQLDAMKDWFVSSVSHELRTPLTNIRSFGEILERYEDLSPEEHREFAGIIREESERLSKMIDDVLDLARISNGGERLKPDFFDLGELVRKCCKLFSQEAEERGIHLAWHMPDSVPRPYADRDAVARVLNNLIGNAFKFTADGGEIDVRIDPHAGSESGGRFVGVRVSDNGVGIASDDQVRIFERFTQAATCLTNKPPGTGIGLAICREIVQKTGGEIWVRSQVGKGSTFGFTLPLQASVDEVEPVGRLAQPSA